MQRGLVVRVGGVDAIAPLPAHAVSSANDARGVTNAAALWTEIRALGNTAAQHHGATYVRPWRPDHGSRPETPKAPSPRHVTGLLVRTPDT